MVVWALHCGGFSAFWQGRRLKPPVLVARRLAHCVHRGKLIKLLGNLCGREHLRADGAQELEEYVIKMFGLIWSTIDILKQIKSPNALTLRDSHIQNWLIFTLSGWAVDYQFRQYQCQYCQYPFK